MSDDGRGNGRLGVEPVKLKPRFYKSAGVAETPDGFAVVLDGRPIRTPAKRRLAVGTRRLADAIAAEWEGQGATIAPETMPLTRLVNTALDGIADHADAVREDIVKYAGSDLVCYRAEGPRELVILQVESWDPLIAWAGEALGARLMLVEGVMPVAQVPEALDAVRRAVAGASALELVALHTMTTLTGSAVIALAVARGRLTPEAAWTAAHVDEDWQIAQWGADGEAEARRAAREREMLAAARLMVLLAD